MPKAPTYCDWRDVPGYDLYMCSPQGDIKNKHTGCLLKPAEDKDGYLKVVLVNESGKHSIAVHRVVGFTYIPNPGNKPQINHIDGNKKNNSVNNLEWVTNKENILHAIKSGLSNTVGENNGNAKLSAGSVKKIRSLFKTGRWNKCQLARMYGVSRTMIRLIVENKNWRFENE